MIIALGCLDSSALAFVSLSVVGGPELDVSIPDLRGISCKKGGIEHKTEVFFC